MLQLTHTRMSLPRYILVKALARLPARNLPIYHRIDDPLIAGYIASGVHEPDLVQLFSACAANGYNGFLLDIGANIGLSTLQPSESFAELHCIEPNPIVFEVLRANLGLAGRTNAHFYNFGLGRSEGSATLRIPKNNWGGAFVAEETAYDEKTLALKDRFQSYDASNYRDEAIVIRKASTFFQEFFAAHSAVRGVVKIDVEGLEETLLEEIAPFCASGNVAIFFENWSPTFDVGAFFRTHFPTLTLSKIESNLDGKSRLLRVLTHVTLGRRGWLTTDFGQRFAGDFVGMPPALFESLRSFRR